MSLPRKEEEGGEGGEGGGGEPSGDEAAARSAPLASRPSPESRSAHAGNGPTSEVGALQTNTLSICAAPAPAMPCGQRDRPAPPPPRTTAGANTGEHSRCGWTALALPDDWLTAVIARAVGRRRQLAPRMSRPLTPRVIAVFDTHNIYLLSSTTMCLVRSLDIHNGADNGPQPQRVERRPNVRLQAQEPPIGFRLARPRQWRYPGRDNG